MTYLDHAATTPMSPEVIEAVRTAEEHYFANASALHTPGHRALLEIEKVREHLANMINAKPSEIIFTSGASEGNNAIIRTFSGCEIETSPLEHHSVLETAKVCRGDKKPKLYSYMLANNETGEFLALPSIERQSFSKSPLFASVDQWDNPLATDCRASYLHSDLTQSLGKTPLDVQALKLDYATFSAHKIGGPLGVGAIFVRENIPFLPLIIGGSQENYRRGSTYNTPGIIGFGKALELIEKEHQIEKYGSSVRHLRDLLADQILTKIPGSSLNTDLAAKKSLPNILNVSFSAAEGEAIQLYLDAEGIAVSTGSACAAGDVKPSHVLMAKTGDAEIAHSSIRFSFGLDNTIADVEKVMSVLPGIIKRLQGISTVGK